MKDKNNFFCISVCIAMILVCAVIVAGCTSSATPAKSDSPAASSPAIPVTTLQGTADNPAITMATSTQIPTTAMEKEALNPFRSMPLPVSTLAPTTTASFSNGNITVVYPTDWEMELANETSLRDYGRITTNIANFYSPDILPLSLRDNESQPNIDKSSYSTWSIDLDPYPVKDFEDYFNRITLALQNHYGRFVITKHNYQLNVSVTDTFPGYKSYQLEFDTRDMRGKYIFTNVDGTIYISTFKNPSPYTREVENMVKSIRIIPQVSTEKHR